jgi:hypothetical protein
MNIISTRVDSSDLAAKRVLNPRPPAHSKMPSTFLASLIVLVLLVVALPETLFELMHIGGQECSRLDPIVGFTHLKNKQITWTSEGFSDGDTNSMGFLDSEHNRAKPAGICRIAMLGDSMTEALQVSQKNRFSNQLESRLNSAYPGRFEVFNFGVSAAGTGQELLTYFDYVEQFKPDIVILFFDNGDEDKNGRKPFMAPWHAHVVFAEQNGKLVVSWRDFDSWMHSAQAMPVALFESMRSKSHLWGFLISEFNKLKTIESFAYACGFLDRMHVLKQIEDGLVFCFPVSRFGPAEFKISQAELYKNRAQFCSQHDLICQDSPTSASNRFDPVEFEFAREPEFHTKVLTPEQKAGLASRDRQRWQLTRAILDRFAKVCKQNGSTFIVAGFPATPGQTGLDSGFVQAGSIAQQDGGYAINFTRDFNGAAKADTAPLRIYTHLSDRGHKVLTDLLFNYLMQNQLLQSWTQPKTSYAHNGMSARVGMLSTGEGK